MEKRILIKNQEQPIPAIINLPEHCDTRMPCVILLHGFMSYKEGDGYLLKAIADHLLKYQIVSIRFDFCSMGENRCNRRAYGMKKMQEEIKAVYEYAIYHEFLDASRIAFVGHSLGGLAALLAFSLQPKCIVTINGAFNVLEHTSYVLGINETEMNENGFVLYETSDQRTELLFPAFLEEMQAFHLKEALNGYKGHLLLCVGKQDTTILPQASEDVYEQARTKSKTLRTFELANHTFQAKTKDKTKIKDLNDQITQWLLEKL